MGRLRVAATLLAVLVVATCSRAQEGSACSDGNGKAGRCISIRDCPPLRQVLEAVRTNTAGPDAMPFLRRSICSFVNDVPLVCCATPVPIIEDPNPNVSGRDLLPRACGVTGLVDHIIDGEDAPLLAWPWMVLLRGRILGQTRSSWLCGGVLINDRYVLSAAHCLKPSYNPRLDYVRVGEHNLNTAEDCELDLCAPPPQNIEVEKIILHPDYQSPCKECNDIMLLRLSRPATLNPLHVVPICLPVDPLQDIGFPEEEFLGKEAWAAGFGTVSMDPRRPRPPTTLQQALIPITDRALCSSQTAGYPDTRSILCAGGDGKDTCRGDSGGPLILNNKKGTRRFLVGITSLGPRVCGRRDTYGLYTNVHHYVSWIIENLRP